jgi:hypothetical protein
MDTTYVAKFTNFLQKINQLMKDKDSHDNKNNFDIFDIAIDMVTLSTLAKNEIDADDSIENKDREKANIGLDLVSYILSGFLPLMMKYPEKMQEIQNLILSSKNNINADMLSDAYKNNLYKL